ncbi:hypothetical protein BGZ73_008306 [Actinomortierella ambigua]|nr:hypothetical protein BGZ73_008306 [Actinomortierella ambigua]
MLVTKLVAKLDISEAKQEDLSSASYPSPVSTSPSPQLLLNNEFSESSHPYDASADSDSNLQDECPDQDYDHHVGFQHSQYSLPLPEDTVPASYLPCTYHECIRCSSDSSSESCSLPAYGCWDELPNCGEAMSLDDIPFPSWTDSMNPSSPSAGFSFDSSMHSENVEYFFDDEPPYCPPLYDEPLRFVQVDYVRDEAGKFQPVFSLGDCGARRSRFLD